MSKNFLPIKRSALNLQCVSGRMGSRIVGIGFMLLVHTAGAEHLNCTLAVTPVIFGAYNVFDTLPNNNSGGKVTIDCGTGEDVNVEVSLSTGQSNDYISREMKSGTDQMHYNIYTTAARTSVWGSSTGGSSVMTAHHGHFMMNLFGRIPPEQDVSVGIYSDSLTVIVNF
jgi:spore coat protein U-like protein